MTRTWSVKGNRKWIDGALAAVLAGLTFVLLLPYLDPAFLSVRRSVIHQPDEGTILSNADRVAHGKALYSEVFDFKGPVGYVPFVVAFKLVAPSARAGRLAMFVIICFWTAAMYAAGRLITGRRSLGVVLALLVPLQIWPAWSYAYQDFTAQFCLTLALVFALKGLTSAAATGGWPRRGSWLVLGGACAALAFWTSVAQGLSGMVALGGAVAMVAGLAGGFRAAFRAAGRYGLGVLLGSAVVLAWLARMGVVGLALYSTIPFPLQYYKSAANITPYAYDELIYSNQWMGVAPDWVRLAVKTMMRVTRLVPPFALAVSVVVAVGLIGLAVVAVRSRRRGAAAPQLAALARVALPAALAATCVPVVLERTRADICHIGFVEGGCLLAFSSLLALRFAQPVLRHVTRALQAAAAVALIFAVVVAAAFHAYSWHALPPGNRDLDQVGRADSGAEFVAARTRPDDKILVTPYGGWTYLYSRRDNATSYALLIEDTYCTLHWPAAARQIVERRPQLLLVSDAHFGILVGHQPRIASLYFGSSGNYMLDDRGSGPPFAPDSRWSLTRYRQDGSARETFDIDLRPDGGSARLFAFLPARGALVRAAIHRDQFSLFDDGVSYIGQVSPDGRRLEGQTYGSNSDRDRFIGVLRAAP